MSTIDERIVQMKFNNKQFESGIQTSLKSLDNLKKSLNLEESRKSLENLEKAGNSFSMAKLSQSVETISGKFSALGIMGVTVLQNITNAALHAGKNIVSALTIDPVKMGFSEYETQINAVQTILANTSSKGTNLTDVNKALDELNAYADRTIYNFTEMTRNIGTFTAAGVDLDTSVQAIKGIANLAAVSGSTSQQASTAMYQLSQALASGTVKLMDWNSVVNAGMGGQVFQDALKETARVHGIKIDSMIKKEGSFRETLQHGWLTSEILTETLSKFTGDLNEEQLKTMGYTKDQIKSIMEMGQMANDAATKVKTFTQLFDTLKEAAQSGWTQSWEIIVGDFEEAKELLTEVSNVFSGIIGSSAEARNTMLQGWKDLGGRSALIESVRNAFHGILDVIKPVKEAFRDIFPPMTGQQLYNITEGLRKLTENFKIGETTANNLKRTFKGVFALIDIGITIVSSLAKGFFDLVGYTKPAGDGILSFTAGIGDFIVSVRDALKASDGFNKIIGNITTTLGKAITFVTNFVGDVVGAIKEFATVDTSGLDSFIEKVQLRFEPFKALGNFVSGIVSGIVGLVERAMPFVYSFSRGVAKAFSSLSDAIIEAFDNAEYNTILDLVNTGLLGSILLGIKKFIGSFSKIADSASGFMEGITGILDGVKDSLEAYQTTLKAKTLMTIAKAIGILAIALVALSLIDSEKLTLSLAAMTAMFVELFGSMAIFEKLMGSAGFKGMGKIALAMVPLATAVLILSGAMNKLANLDWDGVTKGLVAIAGLSATLVLSAKSLSKSSGKLIKGSTGLVVFAGAILVLTEAVENLSTIDTKGLISGLLGVGALLLGLSLFLNKTNLDGMGMFKGVGLIALAGAMNILGSAVEKIGDLDPKTWAKGLLGVGALLGALGLFINGTINAKHVISTAVGMTILSGAMHILVAAVEKFGNLSMEQIGKGLFTMATSLLAITAAMIALPPNMVGKSVGMVGVATALVILSKALSNMGGMTVEQIAKGLITLAGSLGIICIAMIGLNKALPGAAALLVISSALVVMAGALKIISSMSWGDLAIAGVALVGMFTILGVASALLAPLTPALLALGGAITLFGVGCVAVAAGVFLFSTALSALAISGVAGAAALVTVITSIVGLIPMIVEQIGIAIIVFAQKIAEGGVAILSAVTTILLAIIGAVVAVIPNLVEAILLLLTTLLQKFAEYVPVMVQAGADILLGFLRGIRDNISEVVQTGIDIVLEFLDGIGEKIPDVVDAAYDLVIDFIDGLAHGIETNTPRLVTSIVGLGEAVIKGLIDGLKAGITGVVDAIKEVGGSLLDGIKEFLGINSPSKEFMDIGGYVVDGLINGLKDKIQSIKEAAISLGSNILDSVKDFFDINSPSKVMRDQVGRYIVQGVAEGIEYDTSAEEAAKIKAQNIVNAFKTELDKFDLDASTADLELKLWETLKGEKATDAEKEAAQMTTLIRKMDAQSQNVQLAKGEYEYTLGMFGEASEETQKAYNKFLEEQIQLAELANEINEIQKASAERQTTAKREYYDYIAKNSQTLQDLGFSLEAIKKEAQVVSGYNPDEMTSNMSTDVKDAVTTAMSTVEQVYSQTAESTFGGLLNNYSNWGVSYATAMSNALKDTSPLVQDSTRTLINDCIAILKSTLDTFYIVGKELGSSFAKGLNAGMAEAKAAMTQATQVVTEPMAETMYPIGEYADELYAQGMLAETGVVENAASTVGNKAASSFSNSLSIIGKVFGAIASTNPVIRPIVDMTNVLSSSKEITRLLGGSANLSATTSKNNASSAAKGMGSSSKGSSKSSSSSTPIRDTIVSVVQNVTSPKAVSTTEVYRQTKSLFSTVKGLVTGK